MGALKQARKQKEREIMRDLRKGPHGLSGDALTEAVTKKMTLDNLPSGGGVTRTPEAGTLRGQIADRAKAGKDLLAGGDAPQRKVVRARAREAVSGNAGYDLGQFALAKGEVAPGTEGYTKAALQQNAVKAKGFDVVAGNLTPEEKARLKAGRKWGKKAARWIDAGT